jgi:hypothetical protein
MRCLVKNVLTSTAAALALGLCAAAPVAAQNVGRDIARDITREAVRIHVDAAHVVQGRDYKFEQIDKQTKTVSIGASGELSLKNIVGDITVKAGGGRDVTIDIVRTSRGRTEADAKLGLTKVTVAVTARGERADVETQYPDDKHPEYAVSVAYAVTAPAGTAVSVDTVSGRVRMSGLQGRASARTVSGAIDLTNCAHVEKVSTVAGGITLTDVQNDGPLAVEAMSSDVRLTNVKARRIDASVVTGSIVVHDAQADGATLSATSGDVEYSGSVAPKGRYEFKAFSGNVRAALLGGFDLQATTFSGRVEADPSLGLAAGSSKKSLRGVVGNGGAAVVATTFSGSVWIGRKLN